MSKPDTPWYARRMRRPTRVFAVGSAGLALMAFFQPAAMFPFVFVALCPLFYRLAEKDVRPFRCGYGFGLAYGLGQLLWIGQLTFKWTGSPGLAIVPVAAAVPLYALYFGLAGWLIARCWRLRLPWLIPVVWAGVEVFRSYIPVFAFPWGLIASPLCRAPWLIQSAHYFTIFGVGALVALVNVVACRLLQLEKFAQVRAMAAVAAACVLVPFGLSLLPEKGTPMAVTSGQIGLDLAFAGRDSQGGQTDMTPLVGKAVDALERAALNENSLLLVLPEGLMYAGSDNPPRPPFRLRPDLPMIFGGQRGEGVTYQSAFAYDDGRWSVADKTRLVIFGEFVPRWIPFLDQFHLAKEDLSAGGRLRALPVGGMTVGPLLCFEGLFPDLAYRQTLNGAQVLAVMSMDDWFMGSSAPDQLRDGSIWRAVETGLPLVRAATTGYSLICDGHGNVLGELPLHSQGALTRIIRVPPPHAVWWLPVFPLLSLLACAFVSLTRPRT